METLEKVLNVAKQTGRAISLIPEYIIAGTVAYARDFDEESSKVIDKLNKAVKNGYQELQAK